MAPQMPPFDKSDSVKPRTLREENRYMRSYHGRNEKAIFPPREAMDIYLTKHCCLLAISTAWRHNM